MTKITKRFSALFLFLFLAFANTAVALPPGGTLFFGGELRNLILIKGELLCINCELDSFKNRGRLRELRHTNGIIVMKVNWVSEPQLWNDVSRPRTHVRASSSVFQKLLNPENLYKEVGLTILLRSTGTADLFEVTLDQ